MTVKHGDPERAWKKVERGLLRWETRWSPVRWKPWRDLFWGREGWYVTLRCLVLAGCLAVTSATDWHTCLGVLLRVIAIGVAILLLCDILVVHVCIAFVSRRPANLLRSAVLSLFSFFQIPLSFSVLNLCAAGSFKGALTWHNALYFSVVTATTLGYGDIVPNEGAILGEALIMAELLLSVAFLGVLIARLIGLSTGSNGPGPGGIKAAVDVEQQGGTDARKAGCQKEQSGGRRSP